MVKTIVNLQKSKFGVTNPPSMILRLVSYFYLKLEAPGILAVI